MPVDLSRRLDESSVPANPSSIPSSPAVRKWSMIQPPPGMSAFQFVTLAALRADTTQVAVFPHPPPDPRATATPFGAAVSRDGVHPSATTHKLIANALIQVINAKYQTSLEPIP